MLVLRHAPKLPDTLQQLLQGAIWQQNTEGMSGAATYRVGQDNASFYLKISPVGLFDGLKREADALGWLRTYLPAPEVLHYERTHGIDYLLMREVPGVPASAPTYLAHPKRLAETLARAMQALHSLDPRTCPFDQRTQTKLTQAAERVANELVDADDFDDDNSHKTPAQLLSELGGPPDASEWRATLPTESTQLVVTHGDFCLPNLLVNDWQLSGFIDVGRLGIGDRYQDLALCARSLADNLQTDAYLPTFFEAYGLDAVDTDRLRYFRWLDELF